MHLAYLIPVNANQDRTIGLSAIYINQIRQELDRMLDMAKENVSTAFQAVLDRDPSLIAKEAVSYTHLEVYKRQPWTSSPRRCGAI